MLPLFLDLLDQDRQEVFKKLKAFKKDFILAGGTAIMLQIGHRRSLDFDCFIEQNLPINIDRKAKYVFSKYILPIYKSREQLTFKTNNSVEVTFVSHPYKPLQKPLETDSISIFHLDDLVANKAYTIGRRGAWRDYLDLFFFLKRSIYDLKTIIKLAQKKFQNEFNPKLFLEQLVYFDDIDIIPTEFIKESYTDKQIKSFLEKQVEEYLGKILSG